MKYLQKKVLLLVMLFSTSLCYAAVPFGSKFSSVAYDEHTKHFVAVGNTPTNDIVAVSEDGQKWTSYNVIAQGGGRVNGKNFKQVTIDDSGNIYLIGSAGDIFVRPSTEPSYEWNFRKVISPMEHEDVIQKDYLTYPKGHNISFSEYILAKIVGTDLKQITRVDYRYENGNLVYIKPNVIKTDSHIKNMGVQAVNVDPQHPEEFFGELFYDTNDGFLYKSINGSSSFMLVSTSNPDLTKSLVFPEVTQKGMSILMYGHDELDRINMCAMNLLDNNSMLRCSLVSSSSDEEFDLSSTFNVSSLSSSDDLPGFAAIYNSTQEGTSVVHGLIRSGMFVYMGRTPLFMMAKRTCAASNEDITYTENDGRERIVVILGEDNQVLVSKDGVHWLKNIM